MSNSYNYYPAYNNKSYDTRKTVQVDPKDQILLTWPYIEKAVGAKNWKSIINQNEAAAKQKYDNITKNAKATYDEKMASVQAARTAIKNKGKAPTK